MYHAAESNGGEGVLVVQQQKSKMKSQRGSKKSKRSLRRRVQFILTSPVHLFRRYVLRKRPKKCPTGTDDNEDTENIVFPESVHIARERKVPCYLLFLGLKNSGKSTTISKLFNGKRPTGNAEDAAIKVYTNATVGHNIGLRVVDTPGFCGSEQQDTRLVAALSSFLKQDLPHRIPTVTFVVARLDDDGDGSLEAEDSHFTRMLNVLSRAEKLITNQLYSNLVLLLTHSQKASNVSSRILKYQAQFAKVFPVKTPIHVIAIDNIRYNSKSDEKLQTYHDIIFKGLKEFSGRQQEYCLNTLMQWFTAKAKRFSIPLDEKVILVEDLSNDFSLPKPVTVFENYEPYFVLHHTDRKKRRKTQKSNNESIPQNEMQKQLQTCIASGSQIVLADNSSISIDKCLVGDKLLGLHGATSVITGLRKSTVDEMAVEGKSVGSIYCCIRLDRVKDNEDATGGGKSIFMYNNDTFELVDASKANVPEQFSAANVYLLELDSPNGTFIMNGFPCFAAVICK